MSTMLLISLLLAAVNGLVIHGPGPQRTAAGTAESRRGVPLMAKKSSGAKLMTVLLEADVGGVGEAGSLVDIKPAFAENFIIAKGLGKKANAQMIAEVQAEAAATAATEAAAKKAAEDCRELISSKFGKTGVILEVQVVPGSTQTKEPVTRQYIASTLSRAAGVKVAPETIEMPDVSELGTVTAELTLHPKVSTSIKVTVNKSPITLSYE